LQWTADFLDIAVPMQALPLQILDHEEQKWTKQKALDTARANQAEKQAGQVIRTTVSSWGPVPLPPIRRPKQTRKPAATPKQ
jgi:hypothetical protein